MGNCQAVDAATLVIQHPNGKVDKLYWPVNAGEIMKTNPGHYVALLLSTTLYPPPNKNAQSCPNKPTTASASTANNSLRITRIKLLRPTDTLLLGHAYRLITSQEVMKGLCAKKQAKHNKNHPQSGEKMRDRNKQSSGVDLHLKRSQLEKEYQVSKNEGNRGKTSSSSSTGSNSGRSRTWQPSLNSISEAGS